MAERILRQPGQDPNYPVCILAAPTGKAASIIGKYLKGLGISIVKSNLLFITIHLPCSYNTPSIF